MGFSHLQFPVRAAQREVERGIDELARDAGVHGIFVQLPLPPSLDADAILRRIPERKNVDAPVPATPLGIVRLLEYGGVRTQGVRCVVVGRSREVALPVAALLRERGNAVTLVDPDAPDLRDITREAQILISVADRPCLITADHVQEGAAVVDAGYNRTEHGVIGDLDLDAVVRVAGAIVPMPGGIGPATIAMLLERTWASACGTQ